MAEKANATENKTNTGGDHDRVAMASRLPDGTPHQTPDFEFIGDRDFAIEASKQQLREQAVSAKDVEMRGAGTGNGEQGDSKPDAAVQRLIDAHEAAAKAAEGKAESEVKARHTEEV
jgi:hypothetical protein